MTVGILSSILRRMPSSLHPHYKVRVIHLTEAVSVEVWESKWDSNRYYTRVKRIHTNVVTSAPVIALVGSLVLNHIVGHMDAMPELRWLFIDFMGMDEDRATSRIEGLVHRYRALESVVQRHREALQADSAIARAINRPASAD